MDIGGWLFAGILIAFIYMLVYVFNKLVQLRNQFQNAFAQIEVQLKRRYDLIPNLIETAKGYLAHERETLQAVIDARNEAQSALASVSAAGVADEAAMQKLQGGEVALGGALGRFNALAEAYPDLKADQTMMQLSEELASTENKVAFSRQGYNDAVMYYNTYRQSFPAVLLASAYGHPRDATLLQMEDSKEIQSVPRVSFR